MILSYDLSIEKIIFASYAELFLDNAKYWEISLALILMRKTSIVKNKQFLDPYRPMKHLLKNKE